MRTLLLCRTLAMMLGLLGGCENPQQLKAANQTLSRRLEECQAEKDALQLERDRYKSDLDQARSTSQSKDEELANLRDANEELKHALTELKKMYDDLASRPAAGPALPQELNVALMAFAKEYPELAEFDDRYGMVKLKSDLTFPPGSALVNPAAAETLAKLVQILNTPEAQRFAVYVAGHTDNMPISKPSTRRRHPTNWYLSAHRAVGVQKVLAKAGLNPDRIAVMGFGEYHPIEPNRPNKKGNPANRRVEIWVVPKGEFLTGDAVTTPMVNEEVDVVEEEAVIE